VLGFNPSIAPIKAAVFPLVNNKVELSELAKQLFRSLQMRFMVEYDTSGAIGRRYRRYQRMMMMMTMMIYVGEYP